MTRRFQFSLADLLTAVLLSAVLGGLSALTLEGRVFTEYENDTLVLLGTEMVAILAVGVLTLGFSPRESGHPTRYGWLVFLTGLFWVFSTLVGSLSSKPRIVANEMAAGVSCMRYAEAQEIYHRRDYTGDGFLQYAQSFRQLSSVAGPGDARIFSLLIAAEGPPSKHPIPKAGYCFKILKAQSANATGGKKSYLAKGADGVERMTLGYALVAYPAVYGKTGRNIFIINNNGTIFDKDLGPQTAAMVEQMIEFDPPTFSWGHGVMDM